MSKYILKYTRDERVKYISHLDFIRMFHRAVRRSGVNFLFSEGFNPHPVMTVAMPLSVGVTSDGEYMKGGFEDEFSTEEIKNRINDALPPGFEIKSVYKLKAKEIDLTKIQFADYKVLVELKEGSIYPDVKKFLNENSLVVIKKSKSGEKPSDIRPHIHSLEITDESNGELTLKMCVDAGNAYNLKPDTVIEAMKKYTDGFDVEFYNVHRSALLSGNAEIL